MGWFPHISFLNGVSLFRLCGLPSHFRKSFLSLLHIHHTTHASTHTHTHTHTKTRLTPTDVFLSVWNNTLSCTKHLHRVHLNLSGSPHDTAPPQMITEGQLESMNMEVSHDADDEHKELERVGHGSSSGTDGDFAGFEKFVDRILSVVFPSPSLSLSLSLVLTRRNALHRIAHPSISI